VLLAEGLPVESYLDVGDRSTFSNGGGPVALYADFAARAWEADGCAALTIDGPLLDAVRRRINARAAMDAAAAERADAEAMRAA
jgi:hypothetical protein